MLTRLNPIRLTETDKENRELIGWAWDSHWWVEYSPGYYKCKWCGTYHTSTMGVTIDFPLCPENPCLQKFKNNLQENKYGTKN